MYLYFLMDKDRIDYCVTNGENKTHQTNKHLFRGQ
jgi:hypothetical protein